MQRLLTTVVCPLALAIILSMNAAAAGAAPRVRVIDRGAHDPAVSPDGELIAIGILGKIWLVPIGGGTAQQLTFGAGWESNPAWSPDGHTLAYARQQPDGTQLMTLDVATGTERTLYEVPSAARAGSTLMRTIGHIAYSPVPARNELYFALDGERGGAQIWSLDTAGGVPRQLTFGEREERSFDVSPDGSTLIVEHISENAGRDLYQVELDSRQVRRLTETPSHEFSVQWSRDGKSLIYGSRKEGIDYITRRSMVDSYTQVIYSSSYDDKQIALHPDGTTAVMAAGRRLYRLNLISGRLTPIVFAAPFELPAEPPDSLTITNARLWDGSGPSVLEHANVLIVDGRITRIWKGEASPQPRVAAPTIDAKHMFLMPALMDNHVHTGRRFTFRGATLLAQGVTTVRDLGTEISQVMNVREAISLGLLPGPDMYVTGPPIEGQMDIHPNKNVVLTQPGAAAELVRALKSQGVDAIKAYASIKPSVLRALIAAAREQELPVTGDLLATTWADATDAGISGVDHLRHFRWGFIPFELRVYREGEPRSITFERMRIAREAPVAFDPRAIAGLFRKMAQRGVALDPTVGSLGEPTTRSRHDLERALMASRDRDLLKTTLRQAYDAGVVLLAGTDGVGSLVDELEGYERTGIPNYAVIQAATINGARWLGKKDFGTIEVGKRAHLILVSGDPLKQVKDLRNVHLVVKDGVIVFAKEG